MRMSTRGRYASRIMIRLAMSHGEAPVSKQVIAKDEGITVDYVEQILIMLRGAGLVRSHRGVRGGFTLEGNPSDITVADVLQASEGPMAIVPCSTGDCERSTACVTRDLWSQAENALLKIFGSHTIEELAKKAKQRSQAVAAA